MSGFCRLILCTDFRPFGDVLSVKQKRNIFFRLSPALLSAFFVASIFFFISASPTPVSAAGTCQCYASTDTTRLHELSSQTTTDLAACVTFCSGNVPAQIARWGEFTNDKTAREEAGLTNKYEQSGSGPGETFLWALAKLIHAVLGLVSFIITLGVVLLSFVLNPIAVTGLFNLSAVYTLWRMVRDFFNLFFILTILFIAFATIFQVQAYNYKKLLWNLILMALLTNFSFPIARFLIDAGNVPMYFFLNSLSADKTKSAGDAISSTAFKTSGIVNNILTDADKSTFVQHGSVDQIKDMLIAIVFIFIFGFSLIALGALLFIRILVLLALIIFSPIGFVGTAIPGLQKFSGQWWDNFLKYIIFGPTSALMLLVSVKVMSEFNSSSARTQLDNIAKNIGGINVASAVTTMLPVIFIWMSISVMGSSGIAGASAVAGAAKKFSKSMAKKAGKGALFVGTVGQSGKNSFTRTTARGTVAGVKNVTKTGQLFGKNVGGEWGANQLKKIGKREETAKDRELQAKSVAEKGWAKGTQSASAEIHKRNVTDAEKQFEEKKHDDAKLREYIDPSNLKATVAEREAAARMLVKKDAIRNQSDLDNAINAVASPEGKADIVRKVDKKVMQDAAGMIASIGHLGDDFKSIATLLDKVDGDAMKMNLAQYQSLVNNPAFTANPELKKKFDGRLRKEGRIEPIIQHEISIAPPGTSDAQVYTDHFAKMTAGDIGKLKDMHGDGTPGSMNTHLKTFVEDKYTAGVWTIQDMQEAYKHLDGNQKNSWKVEGLVP